jgi:5-hydroxyisourate hydrolase
MSEAGRLTTHVLDTANGRPAKGLAIELFGLSGDERTLLTSVKTNDDGRCDGPLLAGEAFRHGVYELVFHVGDYFGAARFLDAVPVRFTISEDAHYHVPLLVSPFGYSTYRGS